MVGLDFTARFISLATRMKEDKKIGFEIVDEGELTTKKIVSLKEFGLENVAKKVSFFQADACNLKPLYHGYDFIYTKDVPFVIRETKRKYQHTIAQMSVWEKK